MKYRYKYSTKGLHYQIVGLLAGRKWTREKRENSGLLNEIVTYTFDDGSEESYSFDELNSKWIISKTKRSS